MERTESLHEMAKRYRREVCLNRHCDDCEFNEKSGICAVSNLMIQQYEKAIDLVTEWAKQNPENTWGAEFTKRLKQAFPEMKGTIPQYIMDRLFPFEFFDRENCPTEWSAPYAE